MLKISLAVWVHKCPVCELLRLFSGQEVTISNREIELSTMVSVQSWVLDEIEVDALVRALPTG